MKRQVLAIPLLAFVVISCAPSQVEIQATVQAAIAQTEAAKPTATPTPTPVPTRTPTETPQPSPTPSTEHLMNRMNIIIELIEQPVEIVDIRYIGDSQSEQNILQIDAKSTADEYDEASITFAIFTALSESYNDGYKFEGDLFALKIVAYDIYFERQGGVVSLWEDVTAWLEDEISTEELIEGFLYL